MMSIKQRGTEANGTSMEVHTSMLTGGYVEE